MYIPFRTWLDDTYESSIKAVLIKDNDTICPLINVSKCYKTHYINPGDSMYIEVKLFTFEEWDQNEYYVNNDVDSLLSRLRLQYCKSPKDEVEGYDIPDIKFGNKPKIYYVIPRGGNIDPV